MFRSITFASQILRGRNMVNIHAWSTTCTTMLGQA